MADLVWSAVYGAVAGATYAAAGYFTNKKDNPKETFDYRSFATLVIGAGAFGGIASASGITPDEVSSSFAGVAITQFVRKLVDLFFGKRI